MARDRDSQPDFPSREALLEFIRETPGKVGVREIARAFHLRGDDRARLKQELREMKKAGLMEGEADQSKGGLPAVVVLEVTGPDPDGELLARPHRWQKEGPPPTVYLAPERRGRPSLTAGDRVLARVRPLADGGYEGKTIRVIGHGIRRVLGIYEPETEGGRLRPTDRRAKSDFALSKKNAGGAEAGELVLAEVLEDRSRLGLPAVKVVERLGSLDEGRALSLISIQEHEIPTVFPRAAVEEAEAARGVTWAEAEAAGRVDLREVPLVTIDGADARDFDDAVFAEPDKSAENPGGWHLIVAIADVAHYVRPGSPLDLSAEERGNSVYFPDRVVPMLPEALSNGWCSLRPDEERSCLAADLWIDPKGELKRHRFRRGLMRSRARLTYEQVQAARDGQPDETTEPLLKSVIRPLYGAYEALNRNREARGVLDLDLPERKVVFGEDGHVAAIEPRQRLDSHKLIEEFMITANVAAAEALEAKHQICMYRVHDQPDPEKVEVLRQTLRSMDLSLPRGQVIRPAAFNGVLRQVEGSEEAPMISRLVLQSQSQAVYSPRNLGHFGLALRRYAHFTSPIRRYSDLLVHRALISAYRLGEGGLEDYETLPDFEELGTHISQTERRAQVAERDAVDRFAAAFLKDRVGGRFEGRITGVTRFGLFISLHDTGADGLLPISQLPEDFYDHVPAEHALVGRRWGRRYRLGEEMAVVLSEADPLTGGILLLPAGDKEPDAAEGAPPAAPPKGRGRARIGARAKPRGKARSKPPSGSRAGAAKAPPRGRKKGR